MAYIDPPAHLLRRTPLLNFLDEDEIGALIVRNRGWKLLDSPEGEVVKRRRVGHHVVAPSLGSLGRAALNERWFVRRAVSPSTTAHWYRIPDRDRVALLSKYAQHPSESTLVQMPSSAVGRVREMTDELDELGSPHCPQHLETLVAVGKHPEGVDARYECPVSGCGWTVVAV